MVGPAYFSEFNRESLPPSWQKLSAVREALKKVDWVMWIDADAVFQNPSIDIHQFWDGESSFIWFSDTINGINAGVFFVRSCPEAFEFLDSWERMSQDPKWRDHKWWDNGALLEVERKGELPGLVMPHRLANSYPHFPEHWDSHDFVGHCTGLVPEKRTVLLEDLAFRAELAFREFECKAV